ncbi:MAG: prevent-host-death protein [Candidatus Schekmanbacteria bacterium RBG_13_48_7]|uniref:Prevent-host-death protein n=1 Tax=Candidatus Schekmanbacteria bacterium RBG_13_48_7 TaxID=1817878 RepID=A0A1F7S378_9BACT|nr:MAG: prevent-host-death protein [Candidatus Schekmanbacteria bacterium RBG_13_48_7]
MKIGAGEFKAKCLKLMDDVKKYHMEIIVTKFGKPVAKMIPVEENPEQTLFGYLKDSVEISGDIVEPIGESWNADE